MYEYDLDADAIEEIREALADDGVEYDDPEAIRTAYSGRGMYGATCLGFVGDDPTRFVFELAVHIARRANDDGDEPSLDDMRETLGNIGTPSTDSMGRSTIYYWPNITVQAYDENEVPV